MQFFKILIVSLFLSFSIVVIQPLASQSNLGSLWSYPKLQDSQKLVLIDQFFKSCIQASPDTALYWAQMQCDIAKLNGLEEWWAIALRNKADAYNQLKEKDLALELLKESLSLNQSPIEKAKSLRRMVSIQSELGKYKDAIQSTHIRIELYKELKDSSQLANCYTNLAYYLNEIGNYPVARDYYDQSLNIWDKLGDHNKVSIILNRIAEMYFELDEFGKAIHYSKQAIQTATDSIVLSNGYNRLGCYYLYSGKLRESLGFLQKALEYTQSTINTAIIKSNLGLVYEMGLNTQKGQDKILNSREEFTEEWLKRIPGVDYEKVLSFHTEGIEKFKMFNDKRSLANTFVNISNVKKKQGKYDEAISYGIHSLNLAKNQYPHVENEVYQVMYHCYKSIANDTKALQMLEKHLALEEEIQKRENQKEWLRHEYKKEYEKKLLADSLQFAKNAAVKELEIANQHAELSKQRTALFSASGGILLTLFLAYTIYKGKKRSDDLLLNILPAETAKELKKKGYADAKYHKQATVLFTDFKNFTTYAERMPAEDVVSSLDDCFKAFDKIVEKYDIEKIKTIGDSYMAAAGLPMPDQNNTKKVVLAALEMQEYVTQYGKSNDIYQFEMRVGIHTGPVVAGIVGMKKFQYDIWGDTVNTAARMESAGESGKVNVSKHIYNMIKDEDDFKLEYRGKIRVKGKGEVEMYFVSAKQSSEQNQVKKG